MNRLTKSRRKQRDLRRSASRRAEWGFGATAALAAVAAAVLAPHTAIPLAATAVGAIAYRRLQDYRPSRANPVDTHSAAVGASAAAALSGVATTLPAGADYVQAISLLGVAGLASLLPRHGAIAAAGVAATALGAAAGDPITGVASGLLTAGAAGAGVLLREHLVDDTADAERRPGLLAGPDVERNFGMERQLVEAASESVAGAEDRILSLLRSSLRGQTAIALRIDSRRHTARIRSAETCVPEAIAPGPFSERTGILGILRQQSTPFVMSDLKPDADVLPWYHAAQGPAHVMAVGLYDAGLLVGFLAIDRAVGQPAFDEVDAIALQSAADEILASAHAERLVVEAERARGEMGVLYQAAEAFNSALTPEDVCEVAAQLLSRLTTFDTLAVTAYDEDAQRQKVLYATGYGSEGLVGHQFHSDDSLAALAIRQDHVLPYSGTIERADTAILGESHTLPELQSLAIFPMKMGQRHLGTFTLGAFAPGAFPFERRDELRMIINYAAAALSNAIAYSSMVQRATTDGMTGLTNHRTFKERASHAVARADRSGRPLSLIMLDIDHFKRVNDTFGHATGDVVIKGIARILHDTLRKVDIGARYGGEEFAIVLEDTPIESAVALAERLRTLAEETTFDAEDGRRLQVTLSLGVSMFPFGGDHLASLIESADQALYRAKRGGRNRVVRYDEMVEISAA